MPKHVPVIFNTLQHVERGDRVGDGCVTASLLKELVYPGWARSKAITPNTTSVREQQPIRMPDMYVLAISKTGHPSRENFSLFAHVCSTPVAWTHGHIRPCCHGVWHTSVGFSCSLSLPLWHGDLCIVAISANSSSSLLDLAAWLLFLLFYNHSSPNPLSVYPICSA